MKKIIITILLISSFLSAETLNFQEAVNLALKNNLAVQISENGLQMMKNNVNPGILLPSVSINGASNYTDTDPVSGANSKIHSNSAQLSTSYTLFSGFNVLNSYKKLKLQYQQTELETRYQVENIIQSLAKAYYSVANAGEQLQLSKENMNISRQRLQRAREKAELGQVNKVELLTAEVDFNRDSISVETVRLNFENSCRNLNVLLNRSPEEKIDVNRSVEMLQLPEYKEMQEKAMAENAEFLAAKYGIDLAQADIKIVKSGYMPTLNLSGSYGYEQRNNEFDPALSDPDKFWSVGLSLNFRLFDGFQRKIKRQNAQITLKNQKLALQQTKLNLEKELASQYTIYVNSKKTLEMERLNLTATEASFDRTRELYELGQVTSVEFREAQLKLMQAKSNIAAGQYNVKLNEIALLQLSGMLLD
jgi:outer membrane protein